MANGSNSEQKNSIRTQIEPQDLSGQPEDMPMNHYVHRISRRAVCCEGCRQIWEQMERQTRLLGEILAVLDEMAEQRST